MSYLLLNLLVKVYFLEKRCWLRRHQQIHRTMAQGERLWAAYPPGLSPVGGPDDPACLRLPPRVWARISVTQKNFGGLPIQFIRFAREDRRIDGLTESTHCVRRTVRPGLGCSG